jgi:SAM-dependent methyltransferase
MKPADINHIYCDGRHYDLQHKEHTQDIPFWIKQTRKYGGLVLELACGTGRITIPIFKEGVKITGLDASESMLKEARKKSEQEKLGIEWIYADCRNFKLNEKFALIFFPFNSMSHLHDLEDIESCFSCVKEHLKPKGRFVIDTFDPRLDILLREPTKRYPVSTYPNPDGKGMIEITEKNVYDDATQVNRIKWYYKIETQEEEIEEELNLRIFYPQEIDALLKYNGFTIEEKFGDYDMAPFQSGSPKQIIICYV